MTSRAIDHVILTNTPRSRTCNKITIREWIRVAGIYAAHHLSELIDEDDISQAAKFLLGIDYPPRRYGCVMSRVSCHVLLVTRYLSRVTYHVLLVTCYLSRVTCHVLLVTCYLSRVTCHVLLVTRYLSRVTCHALLVTCYLSRVTCHVLLVTR